jgi:hypothetical protein
VGATGATGPVGPIGPAGPTGATGPAGEGASLAFTNPAGPIAVFPPLNTEVTVASVTQAVEAGDNVLVNGMVATAFSVTSNSSYTMEVRVYRDATLIRQIQVSDTRSAAGTITVPIPVVFTDTAPATSAATTYSLRAIVQAATNITSSSVTSRSLATLTY